MLEFSGLLLKLLAEPTAVLFGELFEQVIKMADQPITETESVLARQTLQQGHNPADQVEAGFDDR